MVDNPRMLQCKTVYRRRTPAVASDAIGRLVVIAGGLRRVRRWPAAGRRPLPKAAIGAPHRPPHPPHHDPARLAPCRLPRRRTLRRRLRARANSRAASARRCTSIRAAAMLSALAGYQRALAGRDHLICYAMKANSNLAVLQTFAQAGCASTSSPAASSIACWPPAAAAKVVFSGVGKTRAEMAARSRRRGLLQRRKPAELELCCRGWPCRSAAAARISLRVNPTSTPRRTPYISTGLKGNKFGIAHERARRLRRAASLPACGGRHRLPHRLADHRDRPLPRRARPRCSTGRSGGGHGIALHHLDLGGGLGITYTDEQPPAAEALVGPCWRASTRAATATGSCSSPAARWSATPACWCQRAVPEARRREELLHRRRGDERPDAPGDVRGLDGHRALHARGEAPQTMDVVGPVCESGDWLGRDRHRPCSRRRRGRAVGRRLRHEHGEQLQQPRSRRRGDGVGLATPG